MLKKKVRELWTLGIPTVLEQALQTVTVYVDTAMVGHIGVGASAAVGLTSTVGWLLNGIFFAISVGMLSLIARYDGAGEKEKAHRVSSQGIWVLLPLALIETVFALGISSRLPELMGAEPEIWHDASTYFFITCCPLLFRGAMTIYGNILRANKDSRSPMIINVSVNLLNIVLNQLLIGNGVSVMLAGGELFIPGAGLGVAGAAAATAMSQTLGGVLMFATAMKNPRTSMKGQPFCPDADSLRRSLHIALPLMGERLVMGLGYIAFSVLVAGLGTVSIAAHSIALTIEEAFYVPGFGIQTAVSTLSGNAVGKKDEKELRAVIGAGLFIAVSIMTLMSSFLFGCAATIMALFSGNLDVIALGARVLRIVALSEPLFAVLIIMEGVFHGIGETRMPLCFAIVTMWGIRIFGTYICISMFSAKLETVWVCMVMDNICRCALLVGWYCLKRWKKPLGME